MSVSVVCAIDHSHGAVLYLDYFRYFKCSIDEEVLISISEVQSLAAMGIKKQFRTGKVIQRVRKSLLSSTANNTHTDTTSLSEVLSAN